MYILKEILDKYNLLPYEEFTKKFGDEFEEKGIKLYYCKTFLIQTDHIPNKIIEAQILNEETNDYTEILNYRKFARQEINRLESLIKEVTE